jgi:hypothetical protein
VDELAIGSPGRLGELVEDRPALGDGRAKRRVVLRGRREEHGTGHLLEVPRRDVRVGVVRRDDLTLLGELEPPSTDPGAWPRIARFVGPPQRPMAPPRPWNSVSSTPSRRAVTARSLCARWSIQLAARNPDSLFESE